MTKNGLYNNNVSKYFSELKPLINNQTLPDSARDPLSHHRWLCFPHLLQCQIMGNPTGIELKYYTHIQNNHLTYLYIVKKKIGPFN